MPKRFREYWRSEVGAINIAFALLFPVLLCLAGLSIDVGMWLRARIVMQNAADSAALSAALAGGVADEAHAVASAYGLRNGVDAAAVTVVHPPTSGLYAGDTAVTEVTIGQTQRKFLSSLVLQTAVEISVRAAAKFTGNGCVLALNASASSAVGIQGTSGVALTGCSLWVNSNSSSALTVGGSGALSATSVSVVGGESGADKITTQEGNHTGTSALRDPYADVSYGSFDGCTQHNFTAKNAVTINPGVYCGGIQVNAGAVLTLNPGLYYLDRGCFCVSGGATVKGVGVTLIFTSSTTGGYATATINGGATIELTAPTVGPMAGIVFFGDRRMPKGTNFKLNGGSAQIFGGAIYVPSADITFAGGSGTGARGCTQLVADTITFSGNSNFALNCEGRGTRPLGAAAQLVE